MKLIKKPKIFGSLILICSFLISTAFAQTVLLPKFKKNEAYKSVRVKMLKAGWKPFHAKDSDQCAAGDSRCEGRPEMHVCAGTGLGNCEFLWKRKGKTVAVFTVGEEGGSFSGYEVQ